MLLICTQVKWVRFLQDAQENNMIKSFELGPYTWNIKYLKRLKGLSGICVFEDKAKVIKVKDTLPEDVKTHVVYHELTHAILYVMEHPLAEDEEFVTRFSDLLYQFEKTKK